LFAPKPTTTTLALPGMAGEGCFCADCVRNLKSRLHLDGHANKEHCFNKPKKFIFPEPAFPEVLGWQPVVPPDEGLARTLPYFRSELERGGA